MSRVQIYGTAMSRTFRTLWMAEEIGLDYEHVPVRLDNGENRKPEYLAVNPSGQIPALRDGGRLFVESMAINLYLARKYGGGAGLWYAAVEDEGQALGWSFFAATQVEPHLLTLAMHRVRLPEAERSADAAAQAERALQRPLRRLEAHLGEREWLVGERFSVADLNVASILFLARVGKLDFAAFPQVAAWLERALTRPAAKKAVAMRGG